MHKFNSIFLAMLVFVYAFSAVVCSVDLNGADGHAKSDQVPDIHCGIDLNSYLTTDEQGSCLNDLASCWGLLPQVKRPHLPILTFSIFKVPKSC